MKIYIYSYILLTLLATSFHSKAIANKPNNTDANLFGHVIDAKTKEHLPYVTVSIKGTTIGTTTDATGHYTLKNLPEGKFTISAKFVGYENQDIDVIIKKGKTQEINFELKESNISLNEVVVSANRNETNRKLAPTLVSILNLETFDRTNSHTIGDGLNFQPGLRVENNCQNCGFTQVRMNGLEGAYSQILIDSRPVFSSLAGVYGLEQIPATMVERIEVVRGGGSALFGASAIAGTINIITKEPLRNSAQLSHTTTSIGEKSSFDNNTNFNVSIVSDNQKMGIMAFGQKRDRSAYDHDGDSFSEIPKLNNRTLGFRSFIKTGTYSKITFEYHNMHEFRRGGDNIDKEPFQAYIAEQIESNIDGGSIKYDIFSPDTKHRFSIYSAAQLTNRKSYYGGGEPIGVITGLETEDEITNINNRMASYGKTKDKTFTSGGQYTFDCNHLLFMPSTLTAGLEYTYNKLNDHSGYRVNSISQEIDVKSLYAQNEWKNDMWGFLIGTRIDKHKLLDNAVFSPRANIRFNPTQDINMRLSYGQGFRAPQLFDEDLHVAIAGGEAIIQERDPNLKEEKSHSLSGSIDWYTYLNKAQINFLVEGFYTKLNNPFTTVTNEQADGSIVKTIINASGAKVYGLTLEGRTILSTQLQFQLGATLQKSRYSEPRKWSGANDDNIEPTKRMMRTPDVYGYFVATWTPRSNFDMSLSGTYTGRMLVPYEANSISKNRTQETPSFWDLNYKIGYEFLLYKNTSIELNAGVKNIFNSYQKDFDTGKDRVSSYIYGPAMPRSIFIGAKISI